MYSGAGGYAGSGGYGVSASYSSQASYTQHTYSIDDVVSTLSVESPAPNNYVSENTNTYSMKPAEYKEFPVDSFLNPDRPYTQIIHTTNEIQEFIEEAFEKTTGEPFPNNLIVHVCEPPMLREAHEANNGIWDDGIQGFALNRQGQGVNEIFVRKDHLDRTMLTVGHEIGHVMSSSLQDARDEEAKAFAFSLAWMDMIVEHNIAGLSQSINPRPARNGLHDVAFDFVMHVMQQGTKAFEVFKDLVKGVLTITEKKEIIYVD